MTDYMDEWIATLFSSPAIGCGHADRRADRNLGMGWLYYAVGRILRNRIAVVIGSGRGFVPMVLAKALRDNVERGQVLFIDPSMLDTFWSTPDHVTAYFSKLRTPNVTHFCMTTQEFVNTPTYTSLGDIGIVFIDGYHTYSQAQFDFQAFESKLAPNGMMLFHDTGCVKVESIYGMAKLHICNVVFLIEELESDRRFQVFRIDAGEGISVIARRPPSRGEEVTRLMKEASQRFNAGDLSQSQTLVDQVLVLDPQNAETWMINAAIAALHNQWEKALQCCETAQQLGYHRAAGAIVTCREKVQAAIDNTWRS